VAGTTLYLGIALNVAAEEGRAHTEDGADPRASGQAPRGEAHVTGGRSVGSTSMYVARKSRDLPCDVR